MIRIARQAIIDRMLEAEIVDNMRPAGRIGPADLKGWWPEAPIEADELFMQMMQPSERARPKQELRAADISRAEEAVTWYELVTIEKNRQALKLFMTASACKKPKFMKMCRALGVSKQTMRNRRNKALEEIHLTLCKETDFLRLANEETICPFRVS